MNRASRIGLGLLVLALALTGALFALVGLPPIMDPDAWRVRLALGSVDGVNAVWIREYSEWAGTDDFGAVLDLAAGRRIELRKVGPNTATHPGVLVLSEIDELAVICGTDAGPNRRSVEFGIDLLSVADPELEGLAIKSVEDLVRNQDRVYDAIASLHRDVQMHGTSYKCNSRRLRQEP